MDIVKEFTTKLIMGLVKNPDIVKIQDFTDEDGAPILEKAQKFFNFLLTFQRFCIILFVLREIMYTPYKVGSLEGQIGRAHV